MSKRLFLGLAIFFSLFIGIVSLSIDGTVNAQIILDNAPNSTLINVYYVLDISELNLSDDITISFDNSTNMTTISNLSNTVDFVCSFDIAANSYHVTGSAQDLTNNITINQSLASNLTNGYYPSTLYCDYLINTTNMTLQGQGDISANETSAMTLISSTLILSKMNMTTQKIFFVDSVSPLIFISNQTIISNTGTANLKLNILDFTSVQCSIVMNNSNASYNTSFNASNSSINSTSNSSNVSITIPLHLQSGNYTSNITCIDALGNAGMLISELEIQPNITLVQEQVFFEISVSKEEFDLGELGFYSINATNRSNVTLTVCPIASGWVQCYMVPTFVNETYPKTQALPYTNKTGQYLIEGIMRYKNQTITRNITYTTKNTLYASITNSEDKGVVGDTITYNASASSGIAPYTYKWTMYDGTKFTGPGAYKKYNVAGNYRTNLTVTDSLGNNYSTYEDVTIKNQYALTIVAADAKTNSRLSGAVIQVGNDAIETNSNGIATFTLLQGSYDVKASKTSYKSLSYDVDLNSAQTIYLNLTYYDIIPPKITLVTQDGIVMNKDAVDLKFKAEDNGNIACSLYIAQANSSWYTLKDSGDNLLSNTVYTFEIRDLTNDAYRWKVECSDSDKNKAYSDEREFVVSNGDVTVALKSSGKSADDINAALDKLSKLSGDEYAVSELLGIRKDLKYLLDRVSNLDRDIHDLSYRRDLDAQGKIDAEKNLTATIDHMKENTPVSLRVTASKTFVKYVKDDDLSAILDDYVTLKNMHIDKKMFFDGTKRAQSKIIVSTRVRNVELYYLNGDTKTITVVSKEIKSATPEDDLSIKNSNSVTFLEVVPKTICQSTEQMEFVTEDYTILKDDPLIEYPSDTQSIVYYIDGEVNVDEFQYSDTIIIDKNINAMKSGTGMSIGIGAITDLDLGGKGVMIIIICLLIIFYVVVNFELIEKVRSMNFFARLGSKKKISYIRVLINDAIDYLKTEDYDKAALLYHEIKLSYESSNQYIRRQVYDESMDLCNQLDVAYAKKVMEKIEQSLRQHNKDIAITEFQKLDNTYNRLSEKYQKEISTKYKNVSIFVHE